MTAKARKEPAKAFELMAAMKPAAAPRQDNAPPEANAPARQSKTTNAKRPPSRLDTKMIGGHFPEPMHYAIRVAGAQERMTVQDIVAEALNDWLVKKGLTKLINR